MFGKITKSIVLTEMGNVTVTGQHDAVQCHLRFVRYHARNSKPIPLGPDVSECVGPREEVAIYADRSLAWCERELGNVPYDRAAWAAGTWVQGMDRSGELVRATDGTLGRLGAGVTLRD